MQCTKENTLPTAITQEMKWGETMENLVEIRNNQVVVSSRQVAEKFGKEHRNVLASIKEIISAENSALTFYQENTYKAGTGKNYPEYLMNRDGFTLLAMGFTGKDALQWKMKYIAAFNDMEQKLQSKMVMLPDFTNPAEAARAWAEQFDKRQAAEQKLEEAKPKVIFADAVAAAKTSILIGDLAKLIKQNGFDIGQKRLFEWLRQNGYLIKRKGADYNSPTQKSMDMKLFEMKESSVILPDESTKIKKTTKVTGKGQIYFINIFKKIAKG